MLICYERTVLLTGWWLVADPDLVRENSTTGCLAGKPNEHSERVVNAGMQEPKLELEVFQKTIVYIHTGTSYSLIVLKKVTLIT